jgi:hypothetical protein
MSSTEAPDGDPAAPSRAAYLYVDDWIVAPGAAPRSLTPVGDMVAHCTMGMMSAKFHELATAVTDLDHDGVAEVSFGYELACRSDAAPGTYRVIVLEDGVQYTLRGETRVEAGGGALRPPDRPVEMDPPAAKWPAEFLEHALRVWDRTADDLEMPPHQR